VFQLSVLQLSSIHRGRTELASHDSRVVSSRGGGPTNIIETSRVVSSRGGGPTNIIETRRRERKPHPTDERGMGPFAPTVSSPDARTDAEGGGA
jgi:hypothetical protein